MKVTIAGRIERGDDGVYRAPVTVGTGLKAKIFQLALDANYNPDDSEPRRLFGEPEIPPDGLWTYRGTVVLVKGGDGQSADEIKIGIKHAILRHGKSLERMRREIEALENVELVSVARRERISDSVRLFVWQRDQGKCVKCGGNERLEFDHIIPVVKGGSNTERNIQLLCERCNREKGASI